MGKRLNFGPYSKNAGLSFEEYVLNALNRIEKWSYDITAILDADTTATGTELLLEDGEILLTEAGQSLLEE